MQNPIVIFDAGIGSYSITEKLRNAFPMADLIYLADRASFPYGHKSLPELFRSIYSTLYFLQKNYTPQLIVLASNVPSITVLKQILPLIDVPIVGVYPPVKKALNISGSSLVGVLGVQSLVRSEQMVGYIERNVVEGQQALSFDASELVHLVESGDFLYEKKKTRSAVKRFISNITNRHPEMDTFTLSSTHLPWLSDYFVSLFPAFNFLDPADDVVASIDSVVDGKGETLGLVSTSQHGQFGIDDFKKMLNTLNIDICLEQVVIPQKDTSGLCA
ncbi:MAG: aspartate/glutamate racemase family protein [Algicola sp.]|nr:aspartate/glutamate racemase family protein [Algicola sp.]